MTRIKRTPTRKKKNKTKKEEKSNDVEKWISVRALFHKKTKQLKDKYKRSVTFKYFVWSIIVSIIIAGVYFLLGTFIDKPFQEEVLSNDAQILSKLDRCIHQEKNRIYPDNLSCFEKLNLSEEEINKLADYVLKVSKNEYEIGLAHASKNNYDIALTHYNKALKFDGSNIEIKFDKAIALSELERYEESNGLWNEIIRSSQDQIIRLNAISNKGWNFMHLGQFKDAEECFEEFLKEVPYNEHNKGMIIDTLLLKGLVEHRQIKWIEAENSYTQIIEINPSYWHAWENRALMRYYLKNYEGALYDANEVLSLNPNTPIASLIKGSILAMLGDHEESLFYLDKALEIQDDYPKLDDYAFSFTITAKIKKATVLCELGRYDKGVQLYDEVLIYINESWVNESNVYELKKECLSKKINLST